MIHTSEQARKLFLSLVCIQLLLVVIYGTDAWVHGPAERLDDVIDLDAEGNLPTWFSSFQLALIGSAISNRRASAKMEASSSPLMRLLASFEEVTTVHFKEVALFGVIASATALLLSPVAASNAQKKQRDISPSGREVTILVTAHPRNQRMREAASKLRPDDFSVREDRTPQQIISVKRASEAPPILAVLIQDDLVTRVNNELSRIKEFIRRLPEGSRVMIGYVTAGSLQVRQDFTTDRERAGESLRILRSSASSAPYNPYVEVIEALRRFDSQPTGRRMILLVSDGLDTSHGFRSSSPGLSVDLSHAISEAQRRGVSVFSFFAPTVSLSNESRLALNFGQGSLIRIGDETGGEAFTTGNDFVSFDPYFKEFDELLNLQWLITYDSSTIGRSFRQIEVTTEQDVHLHYAKGYAPR